MDLFKQFKRAPKPVAEDEPTEEEKILGQIHNLETLGRFEAENVESGIKDKIRELRKKLAALTVAKIGGKAIDLAFLKEALPTGLPAWMLINPANSGFSLWVQPRSFREPQSTLNTWIPEGMENPYEDIIKKMGEFSSRNHNGATISIGGRLPEGAMPDEIREQVFHAQHQDFRIFLAAPASNWIFGQMVTMPRAEVIVIAWKDFASFELGRYTPIPVAEYVKKRLKID